MATTDIGIKLSLQGANEVQSGLDRVGTGLRGMATNAKESVSSVKELALAMGAAFSVKAIIDAADAVTTLRNQLKLATGSASEAKTAYAALFDVAQRARVSFTDLGGTYASLARAGEQLGVSQQRLLGVTEAISNAVTISGGSAESAKASLVQLSQGLASGTLRGDELNSVMEQTPRLASALAAGLGVTTGELRKLGEAGEITADKVIRALESQAGVLKGEVAGSVLTVGQAWQQLQNASVKTIGDFDAATGASAALASAMQALAGAITTVGQAAREHETATKVFFGLIAGAAVATTVGAIASALGGLVTVIGGIGAAVGTVGAVIAAANPVTLALLGIGAAVGAVAAYSSAQGKSLDNVSQKISDISKEIAELDAAIERSNGAKGVLLGNGAVTTKERANYLVEGLRKQRAEMQALLAENTAPSASMLLRRMDNQEDAAARAQDKINAEQIEKARALVKTKNAILEAGYKEAVTIAQNYQGAIDAAEKSGDTDKQRELISQRSALLIASAKETAEAVKSFNERDTATAREAAKERLEVQIAGYERAGQAFDDYQKQQQKSLETAHALGLSSEAEYIRAKEQLELGVNQGKQDLAHQELQAVQKSGLLQKDRIAQEQKYTTEIQKLKDQQTQIANDAANAIAIAERKEYMAAMNSNADTVEQAQQRAAQLQEQLRAQQAANKEIGLSAKEVIALRTATAELTAVELERRAGLIEDAKPAYAQALRDQAAAIRGIATANAEALEKSAAIEQFNAVWASVDRTAHDTFVNIFQGGQDAFTKLRDVLKATLLDLLYQMTIRKWVFDITANVVPGASSATAATVNGAGSLLGSGNGLGSLGSVGSSLGLFGSGFKAGLGAVFGESGTLGGLSAGTTALGAGNIMGGLGTLAGTVMPWLAGASLLQSLTGYSVKSDGSALLANLGGGTTHGVAIRSDYTQSSSGIFSGGTTHNSDWKDADAQVTQFINDQVKLVTDAARAYGTALGLPVDKLDGFSKQIEVSLNGLDAAGVQKALQGAIDGFANDLVSSSFGDSLKAFAKQGETAGATLARVASEVATVNATFAKLGGQLFALDAAGIKAADGLVQAMGGLEAFQQQTASYYQNYYTAEEQRLMQAQDIAAKLAASGITVSVEQVLSGTREQFRALVDGFTKDGGLMTESGQKAVAALMSVADAFASITEASKASTEQLKKETEEKGNAAAATSAPIPSGGSSVPAEIQTYGQDFWKFDKAFALLQNYTIHGYEALGQSIFKNLHDSYLKPFYEEQGLRAELAELTEQLRVSKLSAEELAAEQAAQAQKALEWVSPENQELYKQVQALKEQLGMSGASGGANATEDERKRLQDELDQLTLTRAQLLEKERNAISESNRELWDKIQAIKEAQRIEAATQDYKLQTLALMGEAGKAELTALQQSIDDKAKLEAGWTQTQIAHLHELEAAAAAAAAATEAAAKALELQKEKLGLQATLYELTGDKTAAKAVLEAQRAIQLAAMDPSLRELQQQIWAVQDAAAGAKEAQEGVAAAFEAVKRAVEAEKKTVQARLQAAQETVSTLTGIFDLLKSQVNELYGTVDSTKAMSAANGMAFIDQAIATAQATGYMPDQEDLGDAIQAVRASIDVNGYKTQFEYDKAQLTLAGKLDTLKKVADPQLTAAQEAVKIAQKELEMLDQQLETAQQQVNAINGVDTSVRSVGEAIAALKTAIEKLAAARPSTTGYSSATTPTLAVAVPAITGHVLGVSYGEMKAHAEFLNKIYGTDTLGAWKTLYGAATRYSYTSDDLDKALGWSSGTSLSKALQAGLPAFAIGTNYVPRDMLAQIHEGEAIIPKAYNPAAGGTAGNARLETLVEGLTKEVQRLQAIVNEGNRSNDRIANAVNGNPEMPMPVETVA